MKAKQESIYQTGKLENLISGWSFWLWPHHLKTAGENFLKNTANSCSKLKSIQKNLNYARGKNDILVDWSINLDSVWFFKIDLKTMKIDQVYSVIYIYNLISAGRNLAHLKTFCTFFVDDVELV